MTSSNRPPTLEEFRARAALTGLTLTEEDIGIFTRAMSDCSP